MAKKEERSLNVTLKNEPEEKKEEIIISLSAIFKQLRRFVLFWLAASIIMGILIPVGVAIFAADQHKNLTALVSFNYNGIEKGKAPDGSDFDPDSLKTPTVIEAALTSLNEDLTELEYIRQGISITGIIPDDAIDKITVYKSIYEQGNLTAGKEMLSVSYNPTQYKLTFNYSKTGFSGERAVEVFNTLLECYRKYFFETYGFNQALGSAVNALDYTDYDYSEAVDVFDSTLVTLQDYVSNLSSNDTTRFRSNVTGYSFSDLSESIATIRDVDLDIISSYVTVNNVTKDRNKLIDYYNYRLESLKRQKIIDQETLKTITDSIASYTKDTIIIYGENQDTSEYTQASAKYDSLIQQKIDAQKKLSTCTQSIDAVQTRIKALQSKAAASKDKVEKVEKDLASLNEKVTLLLQKVNQTANEYYETVYLANSYSILVPASTSGLRTTKNVIRSSLEPLLIVEALLFVIYFGTSFINALVLEIRAKKEENDTTPVDEQVFAPSLNDIIITTKQEVPVSVVIPTEKPPAPTEVPSVPTEIPSTEEEAPQDTEPAPQEEASETENHESV